MILNFGPASPCFVKLLLTNLTNRYSRRLWTNSTTASRILARWACSVPTGCKHPSMTTASVRCHLPKV